MSTEQRAGTPLLFALALTLLVQFIQIVDGKDKAVICSDTPPLLPHNDEYHRLCENTFPNFDLHWPCFTHVEGNLQGADIPSTAKGKESSHDSMILAKNADLVDFTPKDASKSFRIRYQEAGIDLTYFPRDARCRFILLEKWDEKSDYRLFVESEDDETLVADTDGRITSSAYICTKWTRIFLEKY
ncbi:related to Mig1 protein [Sporisorium scitamineum]|uniref:Related to Mig1 protein n=1 Tax=Sporisorium scitamineum TaxID=49012 RepID=A0A127Z3J8_9BASI|nr:related to Mig1 protein [Sporisorium scitamineum]